MSDLTLNRWSTCWKSNLAGGTHWQVNTLIDLARAINERRVAIGKTRILINGDDNPTFGFYDVMSVMMQLRDAVLELLPYYINYEDSNGDWSDFITPDYTRYVSLLIDGQMSDTWYYGGNNISIPLNNWPIGMDPCWTLESILASIGDEELFIPENFFNPVSTSTPFINWAWQMYSIINQLVWCKGIYWWNGNETHADGMGDIDWFNSAEEAMNFKSYQYPAYEGRARFSCERFPETSCMTVHSGSLWKLLHYAYISNYPNYHSNCQNVANLYPGSICESSVDIYVRGGTWHYRPGFDFSIIPPENMFHGVGTLNPVVHSNNKFTDFSSASQSASRRGNLFGFPDVTSETFNQYTGPTSYKCQSVMAMAYPVNVVPTLWVDPFTTYLTSNSYAVKYYYWDVQPAIEKYDVDNGFKYLNRIDVNGGYRIV